MQGRLCYVVPCANEAKPCTNIYTNVKCKFRPFSEYFQMLTALSEISAFSVRQRCVTSWKQKAQSSFLSRTILSHRVLRIRAFQNCTTHCAVLLFKHLVSTYTLTDINITKYVRALNKGLRLSLNTVVMVEERRFCWI